jgi:LemA protein
VIALIIVLILIALVVIFAIVTFNGVVRLRNRVDAAWSQIDVQLKRRYDLIPNLVETVKGYAAHERQTLEAVIQARNMGVNAQGPAQQAQAENILSGALKSLFALSEAYPDLKANQNFSQLQEELTGTEGRIAYARQFYNDTVQRYNTKIQTFPAVVVAGAMNFSPREYFEVDEQAREPVRVSFDTTDATANQPAVNPPTGEPPATGTPPQTSGQPPAAGQAPQ